MAYTKTNWVNNTTPALAADALNHNEQGISDATDIATAASSAAGAIAAAKGASNGYAPLDSNGFVPSANLPAGGGGQLVTPLGALFGR